MLIFVYGTLKRGYGNNILLSTANYVGDATTVEPFVMYRIGFPFIISKNQNWTETEASYAGRVFGEVFEIDKNKHLPALDCLEGEGTFYERKKLQVTLEETNETITVSAYEFHPLAGKRYRSKAELVEPTEGRINWNRA